MWAGTVNTHERGRGQALGIGSHVGWNRESREKNGVGHNMKITKAKEKLWTWSRNRTDSHGRGWNIRTPPLSTRSAKSKGICQILSKLIDVIDQQFTYRYKNKLTYLIYVF